MTWRPSIHPSISPSHIHPSIYLQKKEKKKRKGDTPTRSPNPSSDRPLPPSPPSSLVPISSPPPPSRSRFLLRCPSLPPPSRPLSRSSEPPNLTGLLLLFWSDPTGTSSCSHERPPRPPLHRRHPFPSLSVDPFEQPPRGCRRHQREGEGAATSGRGRALPSAAAERWSPGTPDGFAVPRSHFTPRLSASCCSYRVTARVNSGGFPVREGEAGAGNTTDHHRYHQARSLSLIC